MKFPDGPIRQSSNCNRDNGLIGIMPCRNPSHGMAHGATLNQLSPAPQCKPGTMGKAIRSHLSAMQWQADHGACLELLQTSPLSRTLHLEAEPSSSGTYRGHKHG